MNQSLRFPEGSRVLRLTLSKKPFAVMATGEKTTEYRVPSDWILSRLQGKGLDPAGPYDFVLFTNGYGPHRPWFLASFVGWEYAHGTTHYDYSNGLRVEVLPGHVLIHLGGVHSSGNLISTP